MQEQHLRRLVDHYQRHVHLNDHLAFYQQLPTIEESIDYASLAKLPSGKRHSHQRRLQRQVLATVKDNLLSNKSQLEQSQSFEEILHKVRACAVRGFGELARYDTALRLAVRLGKFPRYVYLHAGTRKGAAALRLNVDREYIPVGELPRPLRVLTPHQIEDFLCIYKAELTTLPETDKELAARPCAPVGYVPLKVQSTCIDHKPC